MPGAASIGALKETISESMRVLVQEQRLLVGPAGKEVDLRARLSRNVTLGLPLVGGPSEAVNGPAVAVALALQGGIGTIHAGQPVQSQVDMVRKVKSHESGFILNPRTMSSRSTVADAEAAKAECGFGTFPITESGRMGGKLLGLVTSRDLEACADKSALLADVMTKKVMCVTEPTTLREATGAMIEKKCGKLPIVNEDMELVALICRGDLRRSSKYPRASRDANRHLLVAAAVASGESGGLQRAEALVDAGADVLLLDTDGGVDAAEENIVVRDLPKDCGDWTSETMERTHEEVANFTVQNSRPLMKVMKFCWSSQCAFLARQVSTLSAKFAGSSALKRRANLFTRFLLPSSILQYSVAAAAQSYLP